MSAGPPLVGALVPAAGQGVRLGPGGPKALRALAGEPLLVHAVRGLRAALAALPRSVELVLVHDAARCLTPVAVLERVVAALRSGAQAVVPVLPVADTVKQIDGERVVATVDRSALRAVQTPQGFRRQLLERAHAGAARPATDDAGLVEALGGEVLTVPGADEAFKVTRPLDLVLAQALLDCPPGDGAGRVG